jgi:Fe-S-cluster-containing dehydrogenase component
MKAKLSRRAFLKASLGAAGTVAASAGMAAAADAVTPKTEPLATLIDIGKCIGCEECVIACQSANASNFPMPEKPFPKMYPTSRVPVEDWSEKQDVTSRLTPYNWLFIQHAQVDMNGEKIDLTIPRRCMHCENPPCVKLCPWGAAKQEENGLSRIDSGICLGGSKCKTVCPWDIPQRQSGTGLYLDLLPNWAGNGVMYKCDRCHGKLESGGVPACIEACPEEVQTIGPKDEILAKARAVAKETGGYIYGADENGGTLTIYVSPVPFDQINRAIDTGKGKPHMDKVKNMMADGSNLAKAIFIAPFAGILAAAGKIYKDSKEGR